MVKLFGEMRERIVKNRIRLSAKEYCAPQIFQEGGDWQGDWQGRTMLALCRHYLLAEEEGKTQILNQLEQIVAMLPGQTNEDGYFGELFDGTYVNEQQISGNSWFLRGLCEYYKISKRADIFDRIQKISVNYLARLIPFYEQYPKVKRENGEVSGHMQKTLVNGWRLSSDVGCAFMMLDGITQAYEVTEEDKLLPIITTMLEQFAGIDYLKCNCQTHATLSGTRGVLRYYWITKERKWLDLAIRNFNIYLDYGTTLNYANYNWFGRPAWTESCAIIDSLMVAQQLFLLTGDRRYLTFMNRCYYNAVRFLQRPNGGAGCELCLNNDNGNLKIFMYEAYFCCTMRLAEGLYSLAENSILYDGNLAVIPILFAFEKDGVKVFPEESEIGIKVRLKISETIGCLKIYIPGHCKVFCDRAHTVQNGFVCFENCKGDYMLELEFPEITEERMGHVLHMRGDWILFRNAEKADTSARKLINCMQLKDRAAVEKISLFI